MYNSPVMRDCSYALTALPEADEHYRYYIEQQLQSAPPDSDWHGWNDDRPIQQRAKIVQVPKVWSFGKQARLRNGYTNPFKSVFQTTTY